MVMVTTHKSWESYQKTHNILSKSNRHGVFHPDVPAIALVFTVMFFCLLSFFYWFLITTDLNIFQYLFLSRLLIVSMIAVFLCVLVCSGVLFIFCLSLGFAFPFNGLFPNSYHYN